MPCPQVGKKVRAHSGTKNNLDDSNGALLKKAYHISHCGLPIRLQGRFSLAHHRSVGKFNPNWQLAGYVTTFEAQHFYFIFSLF